MRKPSCHRPCCHRFIKQKILKSCCRLKTCNLCPDFSPTSPIRDVPKADAIVWQPYHQCLLHPKKVGNLAVDDQKVKRTNEIKTAQPLLDAIEIENKDITADALLTQRKFAEYIVEQRGAHYHFTVKNNQPGLFDDIGLYFKDRGQPDFILCDPPDHGRIEERKIWTTTELNDFLDFPHVQQAFAIERRCTDKKSGKQSFEITYGITSRPAEQADARCLLAINRGHWCIENKCHYIIDWNFDEDRSRIRKGHGPENITRLRRFAVSAIKSKGVRSVAQKMRQLARNVRLVFDYLAMTDNCRPTTTRA